MSTFNLRPYFVAVVREYNSNYILEGVELGSYESALDDLDAVFVEAVTQGGKHWTAIYGFVEKRFDISDVNDWTALSDE